MKPGPIHRLKTIKKSHELRLIRPKTPHKTPEHIIKILNTTNTICGENQESSLVQVSLSQEM